MTKKQKTKSENFEDEEEPEEDEEINLTSLYNLVTNLKKEFLILKENTPNFNLRCGDIETNSNSPIDNIRVVETLLKSKRISNYLNVNFPKKINAFHPSQ